MPQVAPQWFQDAVNYPRQTNRLLVEEKHINYQIWGDKKKPALLLIHGNDVRRRKCHCCAR